MKRYKITVAYDGTAYAGWQVQPNGITIQEKIEKALLKISGETVKVHGSGRTDQGVHARGQVAHFELQANRNLARIKRALNSILPPDIRILKINTAGPAFHARRSAISKEYRYFITDSEIMDPFLRLYRTHVRKKLDVKAMKKAASLLTGRHDFAAFTSNPNQDIDSTVRNLTKLEVKKHGSDIVVIARGEGFLYKMVRSLVGFLIRVGQGAVSPDEASAILKSKQRTARVPTAPPQGLFSLACRLLIWQYPRLMKIRILPSLLAADVGRLEYEARRAEEAGADALHLDIMDGHFVPNLSFGPNVVKMARKHLRIPLSVHLMLSKPEQFISRFIEAGADSLLIHIEADCDVPETLELIKELGAKPGITLNPETPADLILPVLDQVDEVLCMTVHPGYGGQAFIPSVLSKIRMIRDRATKTGKQACILVDGGINQETAVQCAAHGANGFIAGTSIYELKDMSAGIAEMRQRTSAAFVP